MRQGTTCSASSSMMLKFNFTATSEVKRSGTVSMLWPLAESKWLPYFPQILREFSPHLRVCLCTEPSKQQGTFVPLFFLKSLQEHCE